MLIHSSQLLFSFAFGWRSRRSTRRLKDEYDIQAEHNVFAAIFFT
jgi:hypothetical protein